MQNARDRIRWLTDRRRALLRVEYLVEEVNRFRGSWKRNHDQATARRRRRAGSGRPNRVVRPGLEVDCALDATYFEATHVVPAALVVSMPTRTWLRTIKTCCWIAGSDKAEPMQSSVRFASNNGAFQLAVPLHMVVATRTAQH